MKTNFNCDYLFHIGLREKYYFQHILFMTSINGMKSQLIKIVHFRERKYFQLASLLFNGENNLADFAVEYKK